MGFWKTVLAVAVGLVVGVALLVMLPAGAAILAGVGEAIQEQCGGLREKAEAESRADAAVEAARDAAKALAARPSPEMRAYAIGQLVCSEPRAADGGQPGVLKVSGTIKNPTTVRLDGVVPVLRFFAEGEHPIWEVRLEPVDIGPETTIEISGDAQVPPKRFQRAALAVVD